MKAARGRSLTLDRLFSRSASHGAPEPITGRVRPPHHARHTSRRHNRHTARAACALVLERSPAHGDDEVRLLLSRAALLAIVIWGCARL